MHRRLLVGTRNPSRIEMVQQIMRPTGVQVITLDALGIREEIDEDQPSTQANAEKKARAYYALSGLPTLSMDGGLHIERFPPDKQPGVLVKRIVSSSPAPDLNDVTHYYQQAIRQAGGQSKGTWTGSQALVISDHQVYTMSFTFEVLFIAERRGEPRPGLSLDPLMIDPASGRYYTEIPVEERAYYRYIQDFLLEHARFL